MANHASTQTPFAPGDLRQAALFTAVFAVLYALFSHLYAFTDLRLIAKYSHFFPGQADVYGAVLSAYPDEIRRLTYPPLTYWIFGLWIKAGSMLFGLFRDTDWSAAVRTVDGLSQSSISRTELAYLKTLYLPFQLATAWFGARLIRPGGSWRDACDLLAQPVVFFTCAAMGQMDILPTFFCVLAVYCFQRGPARRWMIGGFLALSGGVLTKTYPILLAVLFGALFIHHPRWRRNALAGLAVFALAVSGALAVVWGPGLTRSFLLFQHMNYSFLIGLSNYHLTYKGYLATSALVFALLAWDRLKPAGRRVVGVVRIRWAWFQHPARFPLLFPWVALLAMLWVFLGRYWMPQYVLWLMPWLAIAPRAALHSGWNPQGAATILRRIPYLFSVLYFAAVPAVFSRTVDSSMYVHWKGGRTWGEAFPALGTYGFMGIHVLIVASSVLSLYILMRAGQPAEKPLGRPPTAEWTALWAHFLMAVLVLDLFMAWPILAGRWL